MNRFMQYFTNRYLPRWLVLIFDMGIVFFSYFLAFFLRFNFNLPQAFSEIKLIQLIGISPIFIYCFWKTKSYSGILRHSTTRDVIRIIKAMISSGVIIALAIFIARQLGSNSFVSFPMSVVIIMNLTATSLMILSRIVARLIFQHYLLNKKEAIKVMIYGAGQLGRITNNTLQLDTAVNYEIVGFIDDNCSLQRKYVSGLPIYSAKKAFKTIIPNSKVKEVVFAISEDKIIPRRKREIIDECLKLQLEVKQVPPVQDWLNGQLQAKAIRRIKIEDLLGRDAIKLDRNRIETGLKNSVVMVTGAAGSIGSEIVRQLITFNVKRVILLDKAESDLYDLQNEILTKKPDADFVGIVGDVTNKTKMRHIFSKYMPTIIFDAAAYKHVPLMEKYPCEAIRVNIGGTKILADLAIEFAVEKFVFISTDKAVNPTNVMGATKRSSEIYIQSLSQSGKSSTKFITTRFGNVLGSNGSVVPLFKKQIERGGPVTVTHRDITRYFMTIPEACQLVLEAGFMGQGGEIFVFDMGEPVKIYDLAKKMISLSGYIPGKDINIKITHLRPGEKLYEELLDNKEELLPTYNDKIMIGRVRKHDYNVVNKKFEKILYDIDEKTCDEMVFELKNIVPEFVSMNSYYSDNDTTKKFVTSEIN